MEYLNQTSALPGNNNALTRSILCKKHGDLTAKDFDSAKKIISEQLCIGRLEDYYDVVEKLQHRSKWKAKLASSNDAVASKKTCMDKYLKQHFIEQERLLQYHNIFEGIEEDPLFKKIMEVNSYDINTYLEYEKDNFV